MHKFPEIGFEEYMRLKPMYEKTMRSLVRREKFQKFLKEKHSLSSSLRVFADKAFTNIIWAGLLLLAAPIYGFLWFFSFIPSVKEALHRVNQGAIEDVLGKTTTKRVKTIRQWAEQHDYDQVKIIREALSDQNGFVRLEAVRTLGTWKDSKSFRRLKKMASDSREIAMVRNAATQAIGLLSQTRSEARSTRPSQIMGGLAQGKGTEGRRPEQAIARRRAEARAQNGIDFLREKIFAAKEEWKLFADRERERETYEDKPEDQDRISALALRYEELVFLSGLLEKKADLYDSFRQIKNASELDAWLQKNQNLTKDIRSQLNQLDDAFERKLRITRMKSGNRRTDNKKKNN